MVKHRIQNHTHSHGVSIRHQANQILGGAKGWIDGIIVDGIVFMGGFGLEDGGVFSGPAQQVAGDATWRYGMRIHTEC